MSAPLRHTMLALPIEPRLVGKRFDKVPPHVSVLPWMDLINVRGDFMRVARSICSETSPLSLVPGGDITVGGVGYEKPAQHIICPELVEVHKRLFAAAVDFGVTFSNPEYLGEGYNPHLTKSALAGPLTVECITVIDNHETEGSERGVKTITDKLKFGSR